MKKIIILNGPNLNLLGEREKNQYGSFALSDVEKNCEKFASKNNFIISFYQSNIERNCGKNTKFKKRSKWFNNKRWWLYTYISSYS